MEDNGASLLTDVADYYSEKLSQHGGTPRGVDWNGEESQALRFEQLSKVIDTGNAFSINDLGCGYGAFYEFLKKRYESFAYLGVDISEDMILAAEHTHQTNDKTRFIVSSEPDNIADYSIASGVFNVQLGWSDDEWFFHIQSILDVLDRTSSQGFAFNCLTSYSDPEKMRDYLFYADPGVLFDLCKSRFSRNVALLHDYDLYEFTILVRKSS